MVLWKKVSTKYNNKGLLNFFITLIANLVKSFCVFIKIFNRIMRFKQDGGFCNVFESLNYEAKKIFSSYKKLGL
jgi:hypothetical protein